MGQHGSVYIIFAARCDYSSNILTSLKARESRETLLLSHFLQGDTLPPEHPLHLNSDSHYTPAV